MMLHQLRSRWMRALARLRQTARACVGGDPGQEPWHMPDQANHGAHGEQTVSLWMHSTPLPEFTPLREDLTVDVCVVGAGIAGLTVAYLLAREGKRVVVLERGAFGCNNTGRTTAHLSNVIDDGYTWLEKVRGKDGARLAFDSHSAAIEQIAQIVSEEAIDCDFVRLAGHLFLAEGDREDTLDDELAAAQRRRPASAPRALCRAWGRA